MQALNDALDELGLTDTYRTFHLKATNPSNSLGLTTCWAQVRLGKFQKIKIIPSIFSDHTMRLKINKKKYPKKHKRLAAKQYATKPPPDH